MSYTRVLQLVIGFVVWMAVVVGQALFWSYALYDQDLSVVMSFFTGGLTGAIALLSFLSWADGA